jgi:hypothetical protein
MAGRHVLPHSGQKGVPPREYDIMFTTVLFPGENGKKPKKTGSPASWELGFPVYGEHKKDRGNTSGKIGRIFPNIF